MELQAVTGQLYVIGGAMQRNTAVPGLLAQFAPPKAARGREHDVLFVHLTLTGPPTETAVLSQDLLDTISRRYYQAQGTVTAALRRAMSDANDQLLRLNLSGSGAAREGAITCAVLRNGELYLVQTGEALALLGHNFGIERLPPRPPDRITPLGRTAGLDFRFFHQRLQTGDLLLLADPRLAHLPSTTFEPALVDTEVESGLTQLTHIIGSDSARLLLIEFTDDAPADLPDMAAPITTPAAAAPTTPTLPAPRRTRQHESRSPSPELRSQPAELRSQPVGERPFPSHPTLPPPARTPDVETAARQATATAALGLSRFTGWLAELMERLRPTRPPEDPEPINWLWPTTLAILIPILVTAIVTGVYLQRGRVQRMTDIKQELSQTLVLAEQSSDPAANRTYYQQMLTLAQEAETLRPNDNEVNSLRQKALTALDQLDGVLRLNAHPLYTFPAEVQLTAVTLRDGFNGGIYTLDGANSTLYQHDTDESYLTLTTPDPQRLLYPNLGLGNQIVVNLIDIMWRPRGDIVSRDGVVALDSRGALFSYYANFEDVRAVPLDLASAWQQPVAMATFNERLYILDIGARQIWKYYPEGEGFVVNNDDTTLTFTQNAELERAIDIDIYSEDASLVLLYGDGRIRYYDTRSSRIQWDETKLLQNGLNTPLVAPVAVKLVGRGLNASIFVADPGSGRIIQIGRGGTVLAQYRANDENGIELFSRISDFAIAETPLRLFVTAGNVLYVATLE